MRLDMDPFLANVNMINFEENKVLVRTSQADTTKGKKMIVSDEPRLRMLRPRSPEPGVCRPTSNMLLEKYTRQQ
jgi:hypothetical protein